MKLQPLSFGVMSLAGLSPTSMTGLQPDYHTPDDDTDRIDFATLERITELAGRAAWMTADGDAPRLKIR